LIEHIAEAETSRHAMP